MTAQKYMNGKEQPEKWHNIFKLPLISGANLQ
uniref:Uncharacterized protein n=1 Tax=Anguilla anguilla TaxID=7936 RepID=A0A0E9WGX4_ANGAN